MANTLLRREHKGAAAATTLSAPMTSGDTTFTIASSSGWPTGAVGPFFVVVDPNTGSEEKILCSAQAAGVVSVAGSGRGVDNTSATTHSLGATVYPVWTATEADELNAHGAATNGVHGHAGNAVGDTDTQTLTNKSISSATNTITVTGGAIDTVLAAKQPLAANLTTVAGYSGVANLTALNALAGTGLLAQTAANTFAERTLTPGSSMISVSNGAGVAGNPTVDLVAANVTGVPAAGILNVLGGANLGADVTSLSNDLASRQRIVRTYTSSTPTNWNKPAAANFLGVFIIATGGGGGGGGVGASSASQGCVGSGGGAGNTIMVWIAAASLSSTEAVSAGIFGGAGSNVGGTSVLNAGGNGGGTTFGAHFTANGGNGGSGDTTGANAGGHPGGVISGGAGGTVDLSIAGGGGSAGIKFATGACGIGGAGGASFWGGGGADQLLTAGSINGFSAGAYGSGGGGAVSVNGSSGQIGGVGGLGVLWLCECYG